MLYKWNMKDRRTDKMTSIVIDKKYSIHSTKMEVAPIGYVYIFDIDGTIADITHRVHYLESKPKNWDMFFGTVIDDKPKNWVIDIMRLLPPERVLLFSGRTDSSAEDTIAWLEKYDVPYAEMRMRWHHNFESDEILKLRMVKEYKDRVRFIVDDRQRVVDMWRLNGFNVLQADKWKDK